MGSSAEFQQLRDLLLEPEVADLQTLRQDVDALAGLIRNPEELAVLVGPVLESALHRTGPGMRGALLHAFSPLVDAAIRANITQHPGALAAALAPASTSAIAHRYAADPAGASADLAPLVSAAIKEQVRGERDAMIDALYPVIGSTISRYLSETLTALVRQINERIESTLSMRSVVRKIRARVTGVSEAELILRESVPFHVDAAFLIHTASGLVIAQAQAPGSQALDPDLLSGMLTAIRGLFNESMEATARARELDRISYGESTILLEVAGHCYLAVVVRGVPDTGLRDAIRETLTAVIQTPGSALEQYAGDTAGIPRAIPQAVEDLVRLAPAPARPVRRFPVAALIAGLLLLVAIAIPAGIWMKRNADDRATSARIREALAASHPAIASGLHVTVDREEIRLEGTAPNGYARSLARSFVAGMVPGLRITDAVATLSPPPFAAITEHQAAGIITAVNAMTGVSIGGTLTDGTLTLEGIVPDEATAAGITRAFTGIAGLDSLAHQLVAGSSEIGERLYFARASTALTDPGAGSRAADRVAAHVQRSPWAAVEVIGHSDLTGEETANRRISLGRAGSVKDLLLSRGVRPERIIVRGEAAPPDDARSAGSDSLSRCVLFRLVPLPQDVRP